MSAELYFCFLALQTCTAGIRNRSEEVSYVRAELIAVSAELQSGSVEFRRILRCSKMFPLSSDFVSRCSEYALQSSEIASRSLFVSERSFQVSPRSLKWVPRGPKWFIGPPKCCRGVRDLFQDAPIWLSGAQFYP